MSKRHRFNVSKIEELRLLKGMTRAEFGAAIGVTERTLLKWLNGTTSPTAADLNTLCDKFDVDLAWFLSKENKKPVAV